MTVFFLATLLTKLSFFSGRFTSPLQLSSAASLNIEDLDVSLKEQFDSCRSIVLRQSSGSRNSAISKPGS